MKKNIIGVCWGMLMMAMLMVPGMYAQGVTQKSCFDAGTLPTCAKADRSPCQENEWTCVAHNDQAEVGKATTETSVTEVEAAQSLLQRIIGWIQVFFYIIATLMIILAAWDYLNSHGSEDKVKEAKQRVIYAIVAIAIAVVAGGVVQLVTRFVG